MHKTTIIPGKNWLLSLAELLAFLDARNYNVQIKSLSKDFFILQFSNKSKFDADDLGGVIKIGEVKTNFSTEFLKDALFMKNNISKQKIINTISKNTTVVSELNNKKKIIFGVSIYCSEKNLKKLTKVIHRFLGTIIKKKLSEQGKKSRFLGFPKNRKLAQLSHVEVIKKKLVENNAEIILSIDNNQTWLSTTRSIHNPFEFQKRDIQKPIQRKIFAMPPRLARILINLSLCNKKKILLDPFCGVGSIIQEGLLNESKVIGVDINPWCVKASETNLKWLIKTYKIEKPEFRVIQGDIKDLSKKIGLEKVDCIVTEPDLGPALHQIPTVAYAKKIIKRLDKLYYFFLRETFKVLKKKSRCVFITPYFKTRTGKIVTMNIDEKAKDIGFIRISPFKEENFGKINLTKKELWKKSSLTDFNIRHKTGREIHILQK